MKSRSTALIMSSVKIDSAKSVFYLEAKMNLAKFFKHLLPYLGDVWYTTSERFKSFMHIGTRQPVKSLRAYEITCTCVHRETA